MAEAKEKSPFADRVFLGKFQPKLKEVEIKNGPNKGKKENMLEMICSKPLFNKDRKIEKWESYKIQLWGPAAKRVSQHLKQGMALEIRGQVTEEEYQKQDGSTGRQKVVAARSVALALDQSSVKSISFENTKEHEQPDSAVTQDQTKAKAAAER